MNEFEKNDFIDEESQNLVQEEANVELENEELEPQVLENTENTIIDAFEEELEPIVSVDEIQNHKKGLIVFLGALIILILLCTATVGGYFIAKLDIGMGAKNDIYTELAPKPNNENQLSSQEVYDAANPSVVGILIYDSTGVKGQASGVVYSEDGYIITNDHIYADVPNAKFKVFTYDNKEYDASFVAGDSRTDLAVLKINSSGFYPATFGDSADVTYGETVYAIGRPIDATAPSSITSGIVSFTDRRILSDGNYSIEHIQASAIINPGSSGGALVNAYGQIIGITSSKKMATGYEGVGFSVPSRMVKLVVESLITNGKVIDRARLGIGYSMIDSVTAQLQNSPTGIRVASVDAECSLYGKIVEGDYIVAVNGVKITRDDVLLDVIESSKPNDTIMLEVIRKNGANETLAAKLISAESSSSYKKNSNEENNNNNSGAFDFPYGY